MPGTTRIEIYSRLGCHLCDEAKAVVHRVQKRLQLELRVIDIDRDPELESKYGTAIPVILIDGQEAFRYRVTEDELERKLNELWNR